MPGQSVSTNRYFIALIAALSAFVALSSVRNGFALDDVHIIFENARVHSLDSAWRLFGQTYWPPEEGASLYRPLTMLAFAAQWVIGNGSPLVFHLFSSILFAATCVAFYLLVEELAGSTVAVLSAALFAIHPVHVEVFANIVGQAEMWVALLIFIATLQFVRARRRGGLRPVELLSISVMYIAACMFKEHAVVLPAILVAVDLIFLGKSENLRSRARTLVPLILALVATAIVFVAIRSFVTGGFRAGGSNELFRDQPFTARVLTMLTVIVEWVRLLFWPASLSADYSYPRTRIATSFDISMLPGILILGSATLAAWRLRKTNPIVTLCLAWIVVTLAIPSNLLIVTGFVLAERTLFLASAAVVILVAVAFEEAWNYASDSGRYAKLATASIVAFMIVAGAARSMYRAPVWRDNATLFAQTVEDVPSSSRAHWMFAEYLSQTKGPRASIEEMLLAVALGKQDDPTLLGFAGDQLSMAGMCPRATGLYLRALKLTPQNVQLRVNTSLCLLRLGRLDEARAVAVAGPPDVTADPRVTRTLSLADSLTTVRDAKAGVSETRPN